MSATLPKSWLGKVSCGDAEAKKGIGLPDPSKILSTLPDAGL